MIPMAVAALVVAVGAWARGRSVGAERPEERFVRLPAPPGWLAPALVRAGVDGDPERVWRRWLLAAGAAGTSVAVLAGVRAAVAVLVVAAGGPAIALRVMDHRGDDQLERSLPGLLEAVAGELRSGASLLQALRAAGRRSGRLAAELGDVVRQVDRGRLLAAELEGWARRRPLPGLRLAVAALVLGAETGGVRGRAIDGVAETLRDRLALRREVAALSSQARASALVMAVTPLVFAGLAAAGDRRSATFLLGTPMGLGCLLLGLALDAAAAWWMHRLIRTAA